MTVLAKYARLEAEGIWRPEPYAQRRDVIVSIGEATITIAGFNGGALAHWSLPAMTRINPGEIPALYKPGPETPELLEIADPEMIAAVDKVLKSIRKGHRPKGRGRWGRLAVGAAILAAALLWLPEAITRYTASLVPGVARVAIGEDLLGELDRVAGAPCAAPAGLRALDALEARLFDGTPTRLIVLNSTLAGTTHLPGGTILIGHTLVEDHETPEVLAGYLLAEDIRRSETDPLARLLDAAGLRAALRLLLQGKVSAADLKPMAEAVVADQPSPVPEPALLARMNAAQVPPAPYGYALDFSGESTAQLVAVSDATLPPILNDDNWIALQRICED
ncbi:MAG: hypothetical protein OIF48_18835 [Silicimonas sp.]|nr:hypothetical protein [Silicimonas sp.]